MLSLKEINFEDFEKEYEAFTKIPESENGFKNSFSKVTLNEFKNKVIQHCLDSSAGINLLPGRLPQSYYFLWDDEIIVGIFKIRFKLNEALKNDAGHIGFGIIKEYRNKGYATKGLKLAIELLRDKIEEDEVYMCVEKDNIYSLKTQKNCGAYIYDEKDDVYLTRIKIK